MTNPQHHVEVAVCTYRRPGVLETLASLEMQDLPIGWSITIVVVDNDDSPSARDLVTEFAARASVPVRYIHCPASNISIARNGALDSASARFLAFVDDDEVARPDWLAQLLAARQDTGADVVLGPVRATYRSDAPLWMRRLDTHSAAPVHVAGSIRTGYSCNVLIDLESAPLSDLRFDPELGRSGGEDTAFFTHAFRQGAVFAEAPNAVVTEEVPAARARFAWLARRRFRSGQTHGRLLAETATHWGKASQAALAAMKVCYCAANALLGLPLAEHRNRALLRGCLHAGTLSGLMGARPIRLYGNDAKGFAR